MLYDASLYIVMEKCTGSLKDLIDRIFRCVERNCVTNLEQHGFETITMDMAHTPEVVVGRVLSCCVAGLDYLRDNQFTHRDIKPDNILFTRGESTFKLW